MYYSYLKDIDAIQTPISNVDGEKTSENTHSYFGHFFRSWFVYVIVLNERFDADQRESIINNLNAQSVGCSSYFPPIHLQPYFLERFSRKHGEFSNTENISKRTIALPFFTEMKEGEIAYVVSKLKQELVKHD